MAFLLLHIYLLAVVFVGQVQVVVQGSFLLGIPSKQIQVRVDLPSSSTLNIPSSSSFLQAWNDHDKGRKASYTDDWLLNFHNLVQSDRILKTNSLKPYNAQLEEEAEATSTREWQESFIRNGLADFTPPIASNLNCLMIDYVPVAVADNAGENNGEGTHTSHNLQTKLPWADECDSETTLTNLMVITKNDVDDDHDVDSATSCVHSSIKNGCGGTPALPVHTKLALSPSTSTSTSPTGASAASSSDSFYALNRQPKYAAVYDCIVDQGLLGSVLQFSSTTTATTSTSRNNAEQVQLLLQEAAAALREHGIYVLTTIHKLTEKEQELLQSLTSQSGLEWQFHLDGISSETHCVSVARRFNCGAMPEVGKLSTRYYHPWPS